MGRGARLLSLLRPYSLLFVASIAATVLSSVLDGFTFVLLIPFLRSLFGYTVLPATAGGGGPEGAGGGVGGSDGGPVLDRIAGPSIHAATPDGALRNVVIGLLVVLLLK